MGKMKLYLDCDGVIIDTVKCITDLYNEDFQYYSKFRKIDSNDINTWDFEECNCASKEYLNTYFNTPRFWDRVEFMPYAERAINLLSEMFDITIVSSGYSPNIAGKCKWLDEKFPNIPIICVNLKNNHDKSEVPMSDGIFVDDNSKYLINSDAKIKICFGEQHSWNDDWTGERITNWADLVMHLVKLYNQQQESK